MEARNQALERFLEALTPALEAAVTRTIEDTRQRLDAQFAEKLQTSVRQAVESARAEGAEELRREVEKAVSETREAVQQQVTRELQAQFEQTLEEARRTLVSSHEGQLKQAQAEWSRDRDEIQRQRDLLKRELEGLGIEIEGVRQERERTQLELDRTQQVAEQWRVLAECEPQFVEAPSQAEMLLRWLRLSESFSSAAAVYTAKPDGLALWKSQGNAVFPNIISQQTTDPESYFKPIVVRGKTVAAVCAAPPFRSEGLDLLVRAAERAIELFGSKLRAQPKPGAAVAAHS